MSSAISSQDALTVSSGVGHLSRKSHKTFLPKASSPATRFGPKANYANETVIAVVVTMKMPKYLVTLL